MATVVVAGGTGGIGRTIVEELVQQGKHKVLILSRKTSTVLGLESVPVLEANYSDSVTVKKILQDYNVEVVISALALFTEDSAKAQIKLINAAIESGTVKRFIPSEYGINYSHPELIDFHPAAKWWLNAADALRASHLDFTRIIFGWLLDHYGFPHRKSHMRPFKFAVDFDNRRAALPGDGNTTVTFLHSVDIAKYIAALLDEGNKWPEFSAFASDKMSWNELVKVAEKVIGEKWDVTYEPLEQLERGEPTLFEQPEGSYDLPEEVVRGMVAEYGIMAIKGVMDVSREGIRNKEFPQVKPVTVEGIIKEAWESAKSIAVAAESQSSFSLNEISGDTLTYK
ncbi:NAD(P)-binding protein [Cucurbitaria berberidis CBS 394.84]|uniref:NAD(P)-binding protein n=1 Tax=Cucurbitaria berberidis CBS 394.84 TaxID=1168544 RepID=A0A9P4GFP7_9PLEO|nr:NAD(P)-binding protein [Cucurbitaria berberidis CBS 394.84]KAF1844389.1 NAD(P)-binding protein [Cucurbitaria berberidis CBS 394.84]